MKWVKRSEFAVALRDEYTAGSVEVDTASREAPPVFPLRT